MQIEYPLNTWGQQGDGSQPLSYTCVLLENVDPSSIQDVALRQLVQSLMNQVEALAAHVRVQAAAIQRLRDEHNRRKGEQGKPDSKPKVAPRLVSSKAERAVPKPRRKRAKTPQLRVDRELVVPLDRSTLPADARFKGYQACVVQDSVLTTATVRRRKATWYSARERRT